MFAFLHTGDYQSNMTNPNISAVVGGVWLTLMTDLLILFITKTFFVCNIMETIISKMKVLQQNNGKVLQM